MNGVDGRLRSGAVRVASAVAAIGVLTAVLAAAMGPPASASAVPRSPRRVLVVTAPRLTWADVDRLRPRNIERFADNGAVASTSVRTAGSVTDTIEGYLTLGAGNRAAAASSQQASVTDVRDIDADPAEFARVTGTGPTGQLYTTALPPILATNDQQHFGAVPGALAGALKGRAGVGAVGNAALARDDRLGRDVALAAIDPAGQVATGDVSSALLAPEPLAPFGLVLDTTAVLSAVEQGWSRNKVMFVELSDLERGEAARSSSLPAQARRQFDAAVARSDRLFGALLRTVDLQRDLVVLIAPTAPLDRQQLTVFAMAGPGVARGWATSSTTRRSRFVTLTDLAPTLTAAYGAKVPKSMTDVRLSSSSSTASTASRLATLVDDNRRAVNRDTVFGPFSVLFVAAIVIVLALAIACQARFGRLAGAVRIGAMWILGVLPWSYLVGLFPLGNIAPVAQGVLVAGLGLVTGLAVKAVVERVAPDVAPPVVLAIASVVVPAVDIATGGRLQISTIFGYSPIVAGRFAGFGNQVFSVFAISLLLVATAWAERHFPDDDSERPSAPNRVVAAVAAVFAVALVLDGHPAFGSDVGGVLALVPTFTVALLMLKGIRIRVRTVAATAVGTVLALGAFTLVDLARPAASRTHLGRFAQQVADGDATEILARKAAANLRVLTVVWTWVIPAALIYFAYLSWRPNRTLTAIRRRHRGFRIFGASGLLLGVLAMALNDSGVSMPAIMLSVALSYTTYLAVGIGPVAATPVEVASTTGVPRDPPP